MTETTNGLGRRIAKYRKALGISTARELAERIDYPPLSTSVIQNIESGRKTDMSVSQLLNISRGLGISPIWLLASLDKPFDPVDLPNVSPAVAALDNEVLDAWISGDGREPVGTMPYNALPFQLARMEWRKLLREYGYWTDEEEDLARLAGETDPVEHEDRERRIARLYERVSKYIDVSWAKGPWQEPGKAE